MTIHVTYFSVVWAEVLGGLIPALLFLATYRPRAWVRQAQVDQIGWVLGYIFFYSYTLVGLALGAKDPRTAIAILSVGRVLVDAFLWNRFFYHRRVRRELEAEDAANDRAGGATV